MATETGKKIHLNTPFKFIWKFKGFFLCFFKLLILQACNINWTGFNGQKLCQSVCVCVWVCVCVCMRVCVNVWENLANAFGHNQVLSLIFYFLYFFYFHVFTSFIFSVKFCVYFYILNFIVSLFFLPLIRRVLKAPPVSPQDFFSRTSKISLREGR